MEFLVILVVLAALVAFVSVPLRRSGAHAGADEQAQEVHRASEIAELEAAREAKYREIRDAELDYRTGKLSDADFEALDGTLREEAVTILGALDRAQMAER